MMPGNRQATRPQGANSCGRMVRPKDEARLNLSSSPTGRVFLLDELQKGASKNYRTVRRDEF